MAFALEQAVDEAALRLKVDPIALRKRWDPDPNRQRLYDWAESLDVWRSRKQGTAQSGRYRRGVGVAAGYWFYFWQPGPASNSPSRLPHCRKDRRAGYRHWHAQRDRLYGREGVCLEPQDVEVRIGDSSLPEGPGSGRSRVTASIVPATFSAIAKLKAAI